MSDPPLRGGRVTALREQENDPERVSVFVDGEFAVGLSAERAREAGLAVGREIAAERLGALARGDQAEKAREVAYAYLAHKPRTRAEVRRRLQRADVRESVIDDVLVRLEEQGYLDDGDYAEEYARQRRERGYGPYRVRSDLKQRGVDAELIERAVDEAYEPEALRRTARTLAEKRWNRLSREDDERRRRKKVHDYLARRGFPYGMISEIVRALTD